jgi:hypothetical protein
MCIYANVFCDRICECKGGIACALAMCVCEWCVYVRVFVCEEMKRICFGRVAKNDICSKKQNREK